MANLLALGLSEGISAISEAWTFVSGNAALSAMISVAVGGVVLSVVMGIFFRR